MLVEFNEYNNVLFKVFRFFLFLVGYKLFIINRKVIFDVMDILSINKKRREM